MNFLNIDIQNEIRSELSEISSNIYYFLIEIRHFVFINDRKQVVYLQI